jgi:amidase
MESLMQRIIRSNKTYVFGPDERPVARLLPGEQAVFETWDALGGRVTNQAEALTTILPPEQLNPATGPVYIEGAEPGDAVAVNVLDIKLGGRGLSRIRPGSGVIIRELQPPVARLIPVHDGLIHFCDSLSFPVRPMVGVIGVSPREPVHTYYPGSHGGNLDINELGIGATVYLPVRVPGALLAIGDIHAHMGDGELTGGGIDITAEVTVSTRLIKQAGLPRPLIETELAWSACANAPALADAVRQATSDMVSLLARRLLMSREEAFILVGCAGDARIGQAAELGMDATAYIRVPKTILPHAFDSRASRS